MSTFVLLKDYIYVKYEKNDVFYILKIFPEEFGISFKLYFLIGVSKNFADNVKILI